MRRAEFHTNFFFFVAASKLVLYIAASVGAAGRCDDS